MKNKEIEKVVLRSMSIGLASMMTILSVPMTVLADEGDGLDTPVTEESTETTDPVEAASTTVSEIVELTTDASNQVVTLTDTVSQVTSNNENSSVPAEAEIKTANDALIDEVTPEENENTETSADTVNEETSAPKTDFEASVNKLAEDFAAVESQSNEIDSATDTATAAVDTANTVASDLNNKLDAAIDLINEQKDIIKNTTDDAQAVQDAFNSIEQTKAQVREDYSAAETAYKEAKEAYENAVKEANAAQGSYDSLIETYAKDLAQAKSDLQNAKEKVDVLDEAIQEIETASEEKEKLETYSALNTQRSDASNLSSCYGKMKNYSAQKDSYLKTAKEYGATNIADTLNKLNNTTTVYWNNLDVLVKDIIEGYYISEVLAPGATNVHVVDATTISDGNGSNSSVMVRCANSNDNYAKVTYELNGKTYTKYFNYKCAGSAADLNSLVIFEKTPNDDGVYTNALYDSYAKDKSQTDGLLFVTSDADLSAYLTANNKGTSKKESLATKLSDSESKLNDRIAEMNTKLEENSSLNISYDGTLTTEELKEKREYYSNLYDTLNPQYIAATEAVIPIWVKYDNAAKNKNTDADEIIGYFDTYQNAEYSDKEDSVYQTNKALYNAFYKTAFRGTKIHPLIDESAEYYDANEDSYSTVKTASETASSALGDAVEKISGLQNTIDSLKKDITDSLSILKTAMDNAKSLMDSAKEKKNTIESVVTANTYIRLDHIEQKEDGTTTYPKNEYTGNLGSFLLNKADKYNVFATEDENGNIISITSDYDKTKSYTSQEEAINDYIDADANSNTLKSIADNYLKTEKVQAFIENEANVKVQSAITLKQNEIKAARLEAGWSEEEIEAGTWTYKDANGNVVTAEEIKNQVADSAYVHWYVLKTLWQQADHIDGVLKTADANFTVEFSLSAEKPEETIPEKETPEKETPEKETPEKETPEKESPEKETPEKESPEKETPEKESPEKESPEKETPEKESPEKETPEKESPEKESPEKTTPRRTTPRGTTPSDTTPEDTTPGETTPTETTPAPAAVLGAIRVVETEPAAEVLTAETVTQTQTGVLGARRDNGGAVLGARRDAATSDVSNAGFFASIIGAFTFLGAGYEALRRRRKNSK